MGKKAFEKITGGLDEVLEIARGDSAPAKLHVPAEIDVAAIRTRLKLSQEAFADTFGFTIGQVRDWEQGRMVPVGGARTYLVLIGAKPKDVIALLGTVGGRVAAE